MNIVFDLDGTLAGTDHRLHFIEQQPKDWDSFFGACLEDAPLWPAIFVLEAMLSHDHRIEIWTGRSEGWGGSVKEKTRLWLARHMPRVGVVTYPPNEFFRTTHDRMRIDLRMRGYEDHRNDYDLKKAWLAEAREQNRAPELVFEDRDRVVEMWRSEGVACFQVAPGDF